MKGGIKIKKVRGINNLIYRGFVPFSALFWVLIQLIIADWTNYSIFVQSVYNVAFLTALVIFICFVGDFTNCVKINKKINSKIDVDVNIKNNVIVMYGVPGTGKSLMSFNRALLMADKVWNDLKIEYWQLNSVINSKKYSNDPLIKKRWRAVKRAYNFWNKFDGIKCFGSNLKIKYQGKFSFEVSKKHIEQRRYLPQFIVIVIEEAGSIFPTTESNVNNKNYRCEDKLRFCRHRNTWFVLNEQNPKNMTNFIRNVVANNIEMTGVNWLYQPRFLQNVLKKLIYFGVEKNFKGFYPILCYRFYEFINSIGYFKLKYNIVGNLETGDGKIIDTDVTYIHHKLNYIYDTYAYSNIDKSNYIADDNKLINAFGINKNSEIVKEIYERYIEQDEKNEKRSKKKC